MISGGESYGPRYDYIGRKIDAVSAAGVGFSGDGNCRVDFTEDHFYKACEVV
jgi:hypothetical protein